MAEEPSTCESTGGVRRHGRPEDYRIVAPVELGSTSRKASDAFPATGASRPRLELSCSRCLEPFEMPVERRSSFGSAAPEGNLERGDEREIDDDDLTTAYYGRWSISNGQLMREQFQLALPMKPLCSDACKGLCSAVRRQSESTAAAVRSAWEDPRLSTLKSLLNRTEGEIDDAESQTTTFEDPDGQAPDARRPEAGAAASVRSATKPSRRTGSARTAGTTAAVR